MEVVVSLIVVLWLWRRVVGIVGVAILNILICKSRVSISNAWVCLILIRTVVVSPYKMMVDICLILWAVEMSKLMGVVVFELLDIMNGVVWLIVLTNVMMLIMVIKVIYIMIFVLAVVRSMTVSVVRIMVVVLPVVIIVMLVKVLAVPIVMIFASS